MSNKEFKAMIDMVGVTHKLMLQAETKYREARKGLGIMMMDKVGKDCWVNGEKFKACMLRDIERKIDIFDFLREVKSSDLRQKILKVSISLARNNLTLATFRRISKRRYTEPRLNIAEIKPKKKKKRRK